MTAGRPSKRIYGHSHAFLFGRNPQTGQFANNVPLTTPKDLQHAYHAPGAGKPALRPGMLSESYDEGEKRLQGRLAELLGNDVQARRGLDAPVPTHPTYPNPGAPVHRIGPVAKAEAEEIGKTVSRFLRRNAR